MTNTITFRSRIPKRELQKRFGNVSAKLNSLLEQELSGQRRLRTLADVLAEDRPTVADKDYDQCLTPE